MKHKQLTLRNVRRFNLPTPGYGYDICLLKPAGLGLSLRRPNRTHIRRAAHKVLNSAKSSKPVGMGFYPLLYHRVPGPWPRKK